MNNNLIYGKNNLERVVSIEVDEDQLYVFQEDKEDPIVLDHKFWALSHIPLSKDSVSLHGKLHYKYINTFTEQRAYSIFKQKYKERDIFTVSDFKESAMLVKGITYFKNLKLEDISTLSFDIETTGLKHDDNSKVLIISNTFRKKGKITRKLFCYDEYSSQGEMISAWCAWVREVNPSILVGHNIYSYDLPYLDFIAEKEKTSLYLGRASDLPMKTLNYESKFRIDGTKDLHYKKVRIWGREVVDTLFLSYKHDATERKYESYGLKQIIKQEKLEVKNRVFYDASQIRVNYKKPEEWEKIKRYAEFDADDSLALFDLMYPVFFLMTQSIPKSAQAIIESASGGQINSMMVRSYLQELHSLPKPSETKDFQGGISFAVPGIYKNVVKIDFSALYPSIMRQYKVFDQDKDPKGHLLKVLEYFAVERLYNKVKYKETKDKYYNDLQLSQKIMTNSFYGFLSAPGLTFNSPECASFITGKARELLSMSIVWATSKPLEYWQQLFEEKTK